ncbi:MULTISPECIES: OmpW family protein [unclassified Salinicola]|uniref:OmpW/AlkL family protein n=1 Tax=unclassified Salinicola TaxID=2634022 RepID=UPI001A8CF1BF|nr:MULTISPECIES: OmpW family outer membrane protein [unclassified Salinicola]MCE3026273.1 outer membrane beta-barrel protein [Salinicola sp. DM10]WIX31483.1 OmpW family outer membrane protein [Salinicola sp. JS01]
MTKTKLFSAMVVAGACAFGTQAAFAYGAGDFFARAGVAKTDVDTGYADRDTGAYLGLGYMFHDKLGVELSSMTETKVHAEGGTFKQVPVNLMAQYYPLGGMDSRVQPYAGVGVNYTTFSSESGVGSVDDSWGATGELGVDLNVTQNFGFNAFAQYTDVNADISGGRDIDLDPVTVGAGAMLRF